MQKLVNEDDQDEKDEAKRLAEKTTKTVELISAYEVAPSDIIAIIGEKTGFKVSQTRAEMFARVLAGQDVALYDQLDTAVSQLGQLMANRLGIGWTGNSHTADYVPITAFGPIRVRSPISTFGPMTTPGASITPSPILALGSTGVCCDQVTSMLSG